MFARLSCALCTLLIALLLTPRPMLAQSNAEVRGRESSSAASSGRAMLQDDTDNVIEEFDVSKTGELLVIPVSIADRKYPFVVDTGCTNCVIDVKLRDHLPRPGRTTSINGEGKFDVYHLSAAHFGAIDFPPNAEASCHNLAAFGIAAGRDIQGFVGMNVLKSHVFQVDFDAGKLRILKRSPRPDCAEIVLFYSANGIPMIEAELPAGGVIPFRIDLGLSGSVQIARAEFDSLKAGGQLSHCEESFWNSYITLSFHGLELARGAVLKQFRIGRSEHYDVKVSDGRTSLLGLDFLKRYNVTFDFPNDRLFLEKGKRFPKTKQADLGRQSVPRVSDSADE